MENNTDKLLTVNDLEINATATGGDPGSPWEGGSCEVTVLIRGKGRACTRFDLTSEFPKTPQGLREHWAFKSLLVGTIESAHDNLRSDFCGYEETYLSKEVTRRAANSNEVSFHANPRERSKGDPWDGVYDLVLEMQEMVFTLSCNPRTPLERQENAHMVDNVAKACKALLEELSSLAT